jgi:CHC2 zinc finger
MARVIDSSIFDRHLDLAPLRGRHRGLVRCCFHQDRTASLSVDRDAGVFNCFGCGAKGGVKAFAVLVGEVSAPTAQSGPPRRDDARHALCQAWGRPGVRDLYVLSDDFRSSRRTVALLRTAAVPLGSTDADSEAWDTLALAARLETSMHVVEAEVDEILARVRIA